MAGASSGIPSLVVSVVGLSSDTHQPYTGRPGIGKSCLCYRFMHPGFDGYVDSHPSLLALHEFESPVVNCTNFLYWGGTARTYPVKGSLHDLKIIYHVVEHTVFYQDITAMPFNSPETVDQYARRVVSSAIESPGKVSYQTRDAICTPEEYESQHLPSNLSKLPAGYIVVIDVSRTGTEFEWQLSQAERLLTALQSKRRKFVIVATKRDAARSDSLKSVKELKQRFKTEVIETSSLKNYNIGDAFRVLAARVLKRVNGLSDHVPHYEDAAHSFLVSKGSAKRSFRVFLTKRIVNASDKLSDIERSEEYRSCEETIGREETAGIFFEHLLELKNSEVSHYAGVPENLDLRLEFLEEFVDSREDFASFHGALRR